MFFHLGTAPKGWVLYDGQCGFCTGGIARFKPMLAHYGFLCEPMQSDWAARILEVDPIGQQQGIKLYTDKQQLFNGVDTFLEITKEIWWAVPIYYLAFLPGIKPIAQIIYAQIAKNRYKLAGQCTLPD